VLRQYGLSLLFYRRNFTMRVLSVLTWIVRIFLFLFLLVFALMNMAPVKLQFFFGQSWELPLVLLLLGFFSGGVFLGVLAMIGALFRERRAASALRQDLERLGKAGAQAESPRAPAAGG
jgi:uncharacterized integral membrane protein